MNSLSSFLLLALVCAIYVPTSTGQLTCKTAVLNGQKEIRGAGPYQTFRNISSGRECMRTKCSPDGRCNSLVYSTRTRTCEIYRQDSSSAKSSSDRGSQVWYCRGRNAKLTAAAGLTNARPGQQSRPANKPVYTKPAPVKNYTPKPKPNYSKGGGNGGGPGRRLISGRKPSKGRLAFKAVCTKLVSARLDPIVNEGTFSGHIHNIFGNSNFGAVVRSGDLAGNVKTTCNFPDDKSMYWSPALYGKLPNGKFHLIRAFMAVYYHTTGQEKDLYAIPKGLRMVVGSNARRSAPRLPNGGEDSISQDPNWLCHYKGGLDNTAYGTFPGGQSSTGRDCTMWQARMYYPDCWNGRDLDSPDHISHMRYSYKGICPAGFKFQIPQMKMESVFLMKSFKDQLGRQFRSGDFVLANGDTTGASFHADSLSGWDEDFMARQLRNCNNSNGAGCDLAKNKNRQVKEASLNLYQPMPLEDVTRPQTGFVRMA